MLECPTVNYLETFLQRPVTVSVSQNTEKGGTQRGLLVKTAGPVSTQNINSHARRRAHGIACTVLTAHARSTAGNTNL